MVVLTGAGAGAGARDPPRWEDGADVAMMQQRLVTPRAMAPTQPSTTKLDELLDPAGALAGTRSTPQFGQRGEKLVPRGYQL